MKKFRIGVLVVLFAVAALLYYAYLSNKDGTDTDTTQKASEISKLLARDLTKDYPETPREVVKLYCRMTVAFYNEERTDEELEKLADMSLMLFDEELSDKNPRSEYLANLKATIAEYAAADRVVTDYTVQNSSMIERYTLEGKDYAKVRVIYNMRDVEEVESEEGGFLSGCGTGRRKDTVYSYYSTYQDFLLRKDDNGAWKLLVWQVPEMEGMDEGDE